jgi:hypothetical protein
MHDEQLQASVAPPPGRSSKCRPEKEDAGRRPAWSAGTRSRRRHVLTANDYPRSDAEWMRAIYERLGLSVRAIQQNMTTEAATRVSC